VTTPGHPSPPAPHFSNLVDRADRVAVRSAGRDAGLVLIPVDVRARVRGLVGPVVNLVRGGSPLEAGLVPAAGAPGGPKV
jgi:hypothetical protein